MKKSLLLLSSFVAVVFLMMPTAYAVNYNVQDIIGAYEKVSPVCEDGSTVGHLVPCSRHCNNPDMPGDETEPCSVCHLIVLGHNVVEYIVFISVFIALAVIVFAGVIYIVSAGDQGMISTAKSALKSALFGLVFVLAAWVIINTLITVFLPTKSSVFQGGLQGNWRQYYCESADSSGGTQTGNSSGGTATGDSSGGTQTGNSSGGTATGALTGADSKVNPAVYVGTTYCGTNSVGSYATMNSEECYTDQAYCIKKFGDECITFAEGQISKPYDVFHVEVEIIAPLQNNNVLVPKMILDFPADKEALDPMQSCFDFITETRQVAENSDGELRIDQNCVGSMTSAQ